MPRILLVDDDHPFRTMLRLVLSQPGYEVVEAANGKEASRLIADAQIDILITDIIMPDKDGLELVPEIRKKYPDVKIIAMSGGGRINANDFLKTARLLGAHRTLTKPFLIHQLTAAVAELLAS